MKKYNFSPKIVKIHMAFFEIFRKNLFFEKKSFILLCVNFDTLYTLYTINMAKCENLLFLLALAVWSKQGYLAGPGAPVRARVSKQGLGH